MSKAFQILRCAVFDVFYFIWTLFFSVGMVWSLLLPYKGFMYVTRAYNYGIYAMERLFLGLDYRVTGWENFPKDRNVIIACKHESTYETLKAQLLFPESIMVLKKELGDIPFWGWYAKKMQFIFVDRYNPRKAATSLKLASKKLAESGKNLLIYPQGTRVYPSDTTAEKPYKRGIAKLYKGSGLPVVPVALNTGSFWPRNSFLKRSGTITFEILPMIEPGLDENTFMQTLESQLEAASNRLRDEV